MAYSDWLSLADSHNTLQYTPLFIFMMRYYYYCRWLNWWAQNACFSNSLPFFRPKLNSPRFRQYCIITIFTERKFGSRREQRGIVIWKRCYRSLFEFFVSFDEQVFSFCGAFFRFVFVFLWLFPPNRYFSFFESYRLNSEQ